MWLTSIQLSGTATARRQASVAQVGNHHPRQVGLESVLGEDVEARHAQVAAALLHLDDDVGRPHENNVEAGVPHNRRFVLAVTGPPHAVSGRLQKFDDPIVEVAL